jgi:hypothetical protein
MDRSFAEATALYLGDESVGERFQGMGNLLMYHWRPLLRENEKGDFFDAVS